MLAFSKFTERINTMNRRERIISGEHGFDFEFWIFSLSFSVLALRDIYSPKWLAWLLCKLGKHSYWLSSPEITKPKWNCVKCGKAMSYAHLNDDELDKGYKEIFE